jgi:hypothetical protein
MLESSLINHITFSLAYVLEYHTVVIVPPSSGPRFETSACQKLGKSAIFEIGALNLAGAGFETGATELGSLPILQPFADQ